MFLLTLLISIVYTKMDLFFNENVRLPLQCGIIYTLHIVKQQFKYISDTAD